MKYIKLSKITAKYLNEMAVGNNNWESWQNYITYNNVNTEFDEYDIEDIVSTYYNNLVSTVLATLNKNGYQSEKESETSTFESTYYLDVRDDWDFYDVCFCINGAREGVRSRYMFPEMIFRSVDISNEFDMMFSEHLTPIIRLGFSYPCITELVYNVYRDKWLIKNTGWNGNQNMVECYYNYFTDNDEQTLERLLNTLCEISQAIRPDTQYTSPKTFKI